MSDIVQNGAFSDMHTVLALSSVTVLMDAWTSPPTKLVVGRDVKTTNTINISIGTHKYPGKSKTLKSDHYVPLLNKESVVEVCMPIAADDHSVTDADAEVVSDNDNTDACPVAEEQPLDKRFLSLTECIQRLHDNTNALDCVPNGIKENMWFKVW